jgi:NTP pyrophosphatase (non-canonical NTP hydrolase)
VRVLLCYRGGVFQGIWREFLKLTRARMVSGMAEQRLSDLTKVVIEHRDARDWQQFHTPKELAVSLCVEAAELLALMQWKTGEQLTRALVARRTDVADELADVFHSLLLLAHDFQIPLDAALLQKLQKDAEKYPVDKSRGKNLKYNEL